MTEVKKVKIQNFIETQIPEFLSVDNPLFKEFLDSYYKSLENQTGINDLANNLLDYKKIENFNNETFFTSINPCILQEDINRFSETIVVNHTIGFPSTYGLIKIDNEIITYKSKTDNSFEECIRGFSGIDINSGKNYYEEFNFVSTEAQNHINGIEIENLNLNFFQEIFKKFKYQFVPGTENRNFVANINLQTILSRAKDFYTSKGTDTSFKLLFKVLFNEDINIIKPQEFMLRPSDNKYFITKNILVEQISGNIDPLSLNIQNGITLFQKIDDTTEASASIYNIEFRPIDNKFLYEISLDPETFVLNFKTTKNTNIIENVSLITNSTIIVDSTIGFPSSGELLIQKQNGVSFIITYTDKTINQFLNISYNSQSVLQENLNLQYGDVVIDNNFAYAVDPATNQKVEFKIISIINDINYSDTSNLRVGDKISLSSFGLDLNNKIEYSEWLYNIPTTHKIKNISNVGNETQIQLEDSVKFIKNSVIELYDYDENNQIGFNTVTKIITSIVNNNIIRVNGTDIADKKYLKKILTKILPISDNDNLINITSNIQNTYIDKDELNLYVASTGFPSYQINQENSKTSATVNSQNIINTSIPLKLYDGEKVYVNPTSPNSGISTGIYFVTTEDELKTSKSISLHYSESDVFSKKNINVSIGSSLEITKLNFRDKILKEQNLVRKISLNPKEFLYKKDSEFSTNENSMGILVNGVELYSPTTIEENIYYGKLSSIGVVNSGKDYDVINTPVLEISDNIVTSAGIITSYGRGAKAHLNVTGIVKGIKIVNPGSGYDKNIKISIGGGNGSGASLTANVIKSRILSGFRGDNGVDPTDNIITFTTPHNFDDGELIEYFTEDPIGITYIDPLNNLTKKLPNNSYYYVGIISTNQIKLYSSKENSSNKINEINLGVSTSKGYHYFQTLESKNTLFEVNVDNSGFNYSNKKIVIPSIKNIGDDINGINTDFDYVYAKNHNFEDKDLVVYSTTGNVISGLSTTRKYFVKLIDNDKFNLVYAGIGNSISDENFNENKIVRLNSVGFGTHTISYPPIEINIIASPDNTRGSLILPMLEPIVLGTIDSVFIEHYGVGYGSSDIINYHRRPLVTISQPKSSAVLRPVVIDGKIVDVQILSGGNGYRKDINLTIRGRGKFAELYPTLDQNGKIISVSVINSGVGYDSNSIIDVERRGSDAKFIADVFAWKINQVVKNQFILDDGGLVVESKNNSSLQYVNLTIPKKLRIQLDDNITNSGIENIVKSSPILGWSYDGFPIYGPYYKIDNVVKRVESSYELHIETNFQLRPSGSRFPYGFFIQDYSYVLGNGDLDEYNGKFIINEEFPNGTYAYFATIDSNSSPQYPYIIGQYFKGNIDINNFKITQKFLDNSSEIIRNTSPYYLNSNTSSYNIISSVNEKYKQDFIIETTEKSSIDSIELYHPGENYKVGDILEFENKGAGTGIYASISEIEGLPIDTFNIGISTYYPVVLQKTGNAIISIANTYFNFKNKELVNISNVSKSNFNFISGNKQVILNNIKVGLSKTIPNALTANEIITIYPNDVSGFEVDDFIKIDDEIVKILEIYPKTSGLRVIRLNNSNIHYVGISTVELLPRKLIFFDNSSELNSVSNSIIYFDASNVVSIGNSIKNYNSPNNDLVIIPRQSIYIPNHPYHTGQPLTYHCGINGNPLVVSNTISGPTYSLQNNQTVFIVNNGKDFIGIKTTAISSSLYFSTGIVGLAHSFKTQYEEVTAKIENYSVDIKTTEDHNLIDQDIIKINLIPSSTETIKFKYDNNIRRITTEELTFNAGIATITSSEIFINTTDLFTGDKVVYYNKGNSTIGGLENNRAYFIINENPGKIKLSNYYTDAINGIAITFTSIGTGTQSISKINPKIDAIQGNIYKFDLSDETLKQVSSIKLYRDNLYTKELEQYYYIKQSGNIELDLSNSDLPSEIYYKFNNVENDTEVLNHNLIKVKSSKINNEYRIFKLSNNRFKFNLNKLYDNFKFSTNLQYFTKSLNAKGPIHKIKVNYSGKGYDKIPKLLKINSENGKNATIKVKSKAIGKIGGFNRVKDGFDYPTDPTLLPLLSVPAVVQVEDISRVDYIGIITGGRNYNSIPTLKVIGNDKVKLQATLDGNSVSNVNIIQNTNDLSTPLKIIPTRNSNGYGIDDIVVNGMDVTLELVNNNIQLYPPITIGYGLTETIFPFSIGDEIFIERCRIINETDNFDNPIIKDNFNSSNYNYRFFTVTGINTENYTITYSMEGIKNNLQLGNYTPDFGYGYVINKKDMAEFEMFITNDLSYYSDETVLGYNSNGTNTFSARVMKNGWDNDINELRLTDVKGNLNIGDKLKGEISLLSGTVTNVNIFNLKTTIGSSRDKLNDLGDRVGFLNDYYQRISDNNYYQKFSYAIKGKIPYNIWKEPIKSLVHPSGFKEFSDLLVSSASTTRMNNVLPANIDFTVNIDKTQSLYARSNFAMVVEEDIFEDGSIERIKIEEGPKLRPYVLSKSNKVILLDDISSQFTGTSNLEIIANKPVTFISTNLYKVGVDTIGLKIGDVIGFSTYHNNPDGVLILSIEQNFVGYSSNLPHRLNSINGISTSVTQNINFYRRVPGDSIVGLTTFKLKNNGTSVFYREFDSENGITTSVNLENNTFKIDNHNFQTGQKLIYRPKIEPYAAIALTSIGSGAILEPVFNEENYSVKSINVIKGGSGYNNSNISIAITGTESPHIIGIFTGRVQSGVITSVSIGNSGLGYYPISYPIGIATTSQVEARKDIIINVGGGIGGAIYENGYNVAISTSILGISSSASIGISNKFFSPFSPYIPTKSTSGIGEDAKFSIFIAYNVDTGNPISTSIFLRDGGRGYSIGDTVSIAGTYIGGSTPTNDLSFKVSKVSNTKIGTITQVYTNIPGNTIVGFGSGAIFNVSRIDGSIASVEVIAGGKNYTISDNISIAGTYIGGSTPGDNLFLSPIELGTDKLPKTLYVDKINKNQFRVKGVSTEDFLDLNSLGMGTHSFSIENPTPNSFITIDNIVQTPVYKKNLLLQLNTNVLYEDNIVVVQSGIGSVVLNDYLKIDDEFLVVKNIGVTTTNGILVERGAFGSIRSFHNKTSQVSIYGGNYRIIDDVIYFSDPPYGPTGLPGLEIKSSFSGRAFSRSFDPFVPNENIIFDDISNQFNGIGSTEFILKSNGSTVSGMFTDINGTFSGTSNSDINQNPFIVINNVLQTGGTDYIIDTPGQNTIKFISGVPLGGKITKISYEPGFGYLPLVGASATVSVSAAGTISNIYLTGFGIGYKTNPLVSIVSNVGFGASIISTVSSAGTVASLTIVNPGIGYTNNPLPEVKIDVPQNHYNIPLKYDLGSVGVGTGAKASIVVGNGSSVISINLDDSGSGYKVGDILVAPGIKTESNNLNFKQFKIKVDETFTDSFSGWYPGQFIQFDDISPFFNGVRKRFIPTVTISGKREFISILAEDPEDLSVSGNLFVFINDIHQVPNKSYTFTGTRIIFTEAPRKGSKCTILFFRGSDLDVEQIDPPRTIKEGDTIQITENINYPFDRIQFERLVKDIISTDTLDTFTYDSIGISTDLTLLRPLTWTKQTKDRILNGTLYSKSRPDLKSKIIPSAKVIKNISKTDTKIYVDNAIPLFEDIDETRSLTENLRDITIVDNRTIETPILRITTSPNGVILNIDILNPGFGYQSIKNPTITFTKSNIIKSDPIFNWITNVGISTTLSFNSIGFGTAYVAVGNSGLCAFSYDEISWSLSNRINSNVNLNHIIGIEHDYVAVGSSGFIYKSTGINTNTNWINIPLLAIDNVVGVVSYISANYTQTLNKISYNQLNNTLVAVGNFGGIFSSTGVGSTYFLESKIGVTQNINSVANNSNIFVLVGNSGIVYTSTNGINWNNRSFQSNNLNDIIWDGNKFIAIGNSGFISTSINGNTWNQITNNLNTNLKKIKYFNNLYTVIDTSGHLYYSFNLTNWNYRNLTSIGSYNDIIGFNSNDNEDRYISVGNTGLIAYSTPTINRAIAISTTNNGVLSGVTLINEGFGYPPGITTTSLAIVESEPCLNEKIFSIKAIGDFGNISKIEYLGVGVDSFPRIKFTFRSENYPLTISNMSYSPILTGDYFTINNSNVSANTQLVGITTLSGITTTVGIINSFLDGIYRAEVSDNTTLGITTVTCAFNPTSNLGGIINLNIGGSSFYGNYSYGIIYDYQNRARKSPKQFIVNNTNSLAGLITGPIIYRSRGLI